MLLDFSRIPPTDEKMVVGNVVDLGHNPIPQSPAHEDSGAIVDLNIDGARRAKVDGFYKSMSMPEYIAEEALSKSGLSDLWISPAHYKARRVEPANFAEADIGSAVHMLVLEPERAERLVITPPADVLGKNGSKNTSDYRKWHRTQVNDQAIVLGAEDLNSAYFMRDSILAHPRAIELLSEGNPEVSMLMTDGNGIRRKCRPDWLGSAYVDLKTSRSAKPEFFGKQAHDLHYHWSAAWTIDIGLELGSIIEQYFFIVVEKESPWPVTVFETPCELIEMARDEIAPLYATYRACMEYNHWPSYSNEIETLKFPRWAYKKKED